MGAACVGATLVVAGATLVVAMAGCSPAGTTVGVPFHLDFDDVPVGPYDPAQLADDWGDPAWSDGVEEERVEIIDGEDAYSGHSLRVHYPAGAWGSEDSGAQWTLDLGATHDELYCAYWVRFGVGFDFVLGGKLPGLAGGAANTGGAKPDGTDGWSARMMWREQGAVEQYVYHPDQPNEWGEDLLWDEGVQRHFEPGTWHHVRHRLQMNTPGAHDGVIEGWFDGELALRREGMRFRDTDDLGIDALLFSTFFGGADASWAASADEVVDFDDFEVAPAPQQL